MSHVDKNLKALISFLQELEANGAVDQGQKEAIKNAINLLRQACREPDPGKLRKAVDHVARIFVRSICR